jgi:2-methylcitrate dehydratase PrpD
MDETDDWDPAGELGTFISSLSYDDIPPESKSLIERCYVDTVGVTVAGVSDGAGKRALATVTGDSRGENTAPIIGTQRRTTPAEAAFVTGTAAHSLDYDDYTYLYPLHPSATIVVPVLALVDQIDPDGEDAIEAYVAGFETLAHLSAPISETHYSLGWHATGTFGVFSAAATAASLLDLSPDEIRDALHIAASTPAGLRRNFGTDTKPMHAGQASRSGVTAALLAQQGFSADKRAITGEGGFYDLYCDSEVSEDWTPVSPGERLAIVTAGVNTKKYPSCGATHSSIEATAKLHREHGFDPGTIERIVAEVAPFARDALRYSRPKTGTEAKFSMQYCIAAALVDERVGLATFDDDTVLRDDIAALLDRVEVQYDDDLSYNDHRSSVTVVTEDARRYNEVVSHPPGTMENPLSTGELRSKFIECTTGTLSESTAKETFASVSNLRAVDSLGRVLEQMQC